MTDTIVVAPTAARPSGTSANTVTPWFRRRRVWIASGVVAGLVALQVALSGTTTFPESLAIDIAGPINDFKSWVQRNRNDNFVLAQVLRPLGDLVLWCYDTLLSVLLALPWFWLPLLFFVVIARSGRWVGAAAASAALLYIELSGNHETGMQTISLTIICVLVCIVVGIPIGILAGLSPRVERLIRPVLDALQTLPVSLFLLAGVMFFGIRQTPAAIATIAFGIPPMIRITANGIRNVPEASVEAGRIFGSSRWQLLWKVQVPQAIPSFVTAINQTIMMCLGLAVIGGLVGAGGLGGELIQTLKLRSPGRGLVIGLAIFAIAFAFDRLSRSLIETRTESRVSATAYWGAVAGVMVVGYALGKAVSDAAPWTFDSSLAAPVDDAVTWIRDHFDTSLRSFSDFVVADIVVPIRDLLGVSIAWPVLILGVSALGWYLRGWRFAAFCAVGLYAIGAFGMWQPGLTTLAQILVAVVVGTAIALPLGVFIGRRARVKGLFEPALDALQTIPSLVYAIPFVMLFGVGFVPSILATMFYAIPAGIRLAALAAEEVPEETLEAATTFGATNRQRLWGVQLPLALRGLVLAVNQLIMLSISMAIVAGQVGENGLGYQSIAALTKPDVGLGVEAGLALLVMAIILDRLGEGLADRLDPTRSVATPH